MTWKCHYCIWNNAKVLNIVFLYLFRQHPLVVNFKYFTIPPLSFIFVFFCIQPTPLHENLLVPGYSVVVLKSLGIRVLCGCITVGLKSFCKHVFFFSWSRIHGNYDYMSPSTMRLHLNILVRYLFRINRNVTHLQVTQHNIFIH